MRFTPPFIMILCVIFSVSYATSDDLEDSKMIKAQRHASNTAVAEHNIDKFVSFFDADDIITVSSSKKNTFFRYRNWVSSGDI